jgi:shikimate kinase
MNSEVKRVFLVGFMGAGKSTVGMSLGSRLGWEFVDLDAVIEAEQQCSIRSIFEAQGEEAFRRLETQALEACRHKECAVIALGGGAFVREPNRRLVEGLGISIFLDCPLVEIFQRCLPNDSRPLFRDPGQVEKLYQQRHPFYMLSDLHLQVGGLSPEEIVDNILGMVHLKAGSPAASS